MNNPSSTSSSSSSSSSTSITSLPLEILLKILTGLPAKSAVRFRSTSKFFHSFIPEPRFAFKILVALPSTRSNLYSVSYSEESRHGSLQAERLDVRGSLYSADAKICVLIGESGGDAVFDLRTGRRICLPHIGSPAGRAPSSFGVSVSGRPFLGFDSVSERYKVFKSAVYYDNDCRRVLNRLWVLTVGVDESWREIDNSTLTGYTRAAVCIHGVIYLVCWTRLSQSLSNLFNSSNNNETKIVAMDVATERFIWSIPSPFEYEYSPQGWLPWIKLNGRLAFVNILEKADMIDIWTLERSMEWEKQTVLLPLEERMVIGESTSMGFTSNSMGEIVFLIQSEEMMYPLVLVYSFEREVWRRFEIHGICNYFNFSTYRRGVVHIEDEIATFLD